ncbi:MAG: Uma2 family endonuclease [Turicibacter sp.]|nr:Uma2 family endonuclease [Turicibacter sp.]
MNILTMSWTSERHTNLNTFLSGEFLRHIRDKIVSKHSFLSQGTTRLVHYGEKFSSLCSLIDVSSVEDVEEFTQTTIHEFHSVEPDLLLFERPNFLLNKSGNLIAGLPSLVVEIWSTSNSQDERAFKRNLYASSPTTEHWYLSQNDNKIERWLGKNQLTDLDISEILETQTGLRVDIRDLAFK